MCRPRTADLVEALIAAHDERAARPGSGEGCGEGCTEGGVGDADEGVWRGGGVEERPEEVEERAEGEGAPGGGEEGEGGVVVRGEEEAEGERAEDVWRGWSGGCGGGGCGRGGRGSEDAAEGLEEVGGA